MWEQIWQQGLLGSNFWHFLAALLIMTHLTILSVTIYLHRFSAHRSLELHPAVQHFFRFWVWLTTAQSTKEWTAIHRKHHAKCETEEDPHSPVVKGLKTVLLRGAELYKEAATEETLKKYGNGTPDDWLERNLYTPHKMKGVFLMLAIDLLAFGPIGITLWAIQMLWMPVFAAGIVNGLGHHWGYRNFEVSDAATNISPWGIIIGGEELHNNHHTYPNSAKLSVKPWEFDIGWMWIQILSFLKLAKVRKVAPVPVKDTSKQTLDLDAAKAAVHNRFQIMSAYTKTVIKPAIKEERAKASEEFQRLFNRAKKVLCRDETLLNEKAIKQRDQLLESHDLLNEIYKKKQELMEIWARRSKGGEELLSALKQWCHEAEQSGIERLQEFAEQLKLYTLKMA
ncbi:DesA family fatty acid desaturase [Litoribrevibacter albus]|uniref:Aminotransferase n=1 Tax=Litoribrevibacter albus TaxID=1473156 RepID=A0AA37W762_9GAMM|nr:fatty acid desaturase [Litoribrevibacter albus]GLQ31033.1 aminotransferase [Litoribrevibacter albus]